jgi:hypothetical protein
MKTLFVTIASFTAAAVLPVPASAHHSAALIYDMEKQVMMEGVVTRFELGNPHVRIYFTPTDKQAEWMAEGGSRTVLLRHGWTDDQLKSGDHIAILGNPSRDGSNTVHVVQITLPDGKQLGIEDLQPQTLEAARARRTHP